MTSLPDTGLKILVADDSRVIQRMLEIFLRNEGHTVLVAGDGGEAVELHRREHPNLVLLDIVMPVMDGLEAARRINAAADDKRTPILFLTGMRDQQTMLEGLELGDDFITKPIDLTILGAKLRAFIRLVQTQRMLEIQKRDIERLNDAMRREGEVALGVMERVLAHTEPPDGHSLQYRVVASAVFSGDLILARRTPSGRLNLLLADAVGHGLPAAVAILPLFFPFDGMSRKGLPLATVARELNRRVRDLLPVDRFVAATLVSIDSAAGHIDVWNGGNPPALLARPDGRVATRVDSMQMALGLNADDPLLFEPRRIDYSDGDQLLLFSDGIWENSAFAGDDPAGRMESLLAATLPAGRMDALIEAVLAAGQTDDVSVVVNTLREGGARDKSEGIETLCQSASRLSLRLGVDALRQADIVDSVLAMAGVLGLVARFPNLPLVFSELFANALEHGVLGMTSELKYRSGEGYLEFYEEKQRRLDAMTEGFVAVEMEFDAVEGKQMLRLMLSDSGRGFDLHEMGYAALADDELTAGRGLALICGMVTQLSYRNQGSEVIALIGCDQASDQVPSAPAGEGLGREA
ncbi:MAG: SpoIIE family protein phosphatase [Sulfuritalea sp.]|jgi:CheY-like chemotaxis protein|nr:SpoIIE family protein phosphatase [Sulfuritalea sp.]